ncbi:uncharacterized protein [Spinacia oleracea]|uniref:Uncharacterized protein n=1 Tax=Spinacia oleracea TaxID=3562 RepID=A0ABM3RKV4_SPIOL|nr:uncharacterized protein LOC130470318 [Spinacia oleracea]XP_056696242.1 uncharacterized protein LOC130470318 [Spinacia oleracea]
MMKGKKRQISDTFKDIYGNVYYEFEDVDPDPEWERIREKLDRERCGSNDTKEENKKMVYLRLVANTQKKRAKPQSPDIESLRWDLDEIPEVPDTPDNPGVNDNPGVGFPHKFRIGVLFPPTTESLPQSHKVNLQNLKTPKVSMDAETLLPKSFTRRRVPSGGGDLFQMAAFSLALRPTMLLLTTKLNFKVIDYCSSYWWYNIC